MEKEKYIFGVVNSVSRVSIAQSLNGSSMANEVYTVSYKDISAVVCDLEVMDYTSIPKDILAKRLLEHQEVIEGIMKFDRTIIPLKLGTFAKNEDDVKSILEKGYRVIRNILREVMDRIEIDITAVWSDFNLILKEIGGEEEVKKFKEKLLANPKELTVDDQMKVGVMVKNMLDKKRKKYTNQIQSELSGISQNSKIHDLMDDKMVANMAFLIEGSKQKDFYKKVEELNAAFKERLNFRCVGPLPPYSFYTLEVKKIQLEDLDWAKSKLAISNEVVTKAEIKKAYQKQVFSSHPDKNPGKRRANDEFDEVKRAFTLLCEYCLACEQKHVKELISFNEEEFTKNGILVKVKD
jgi:hypothetical protein